MSIKPPIDLQIIRGSPQYFREQAKKVQLEQQVLQKWERRLQKSAPPTLIISAVATLAFALSMHKPTFPLLKYSSTIWGGSLLTYSFLTFKQQMSRTSLKKQIQEIDDQFKKRKKEISQQVDIDQLNAAAWEIYQGQAELLHSALKHCDPKAVEIVKIEENLKNSAPVAKAGRLEKKQWKKRGLFFGGVSIGSWLLFTASLFLFGRKSLPMACAGSASALSTSMIAISFFSVKRTASEMRSYHAGGSVDQTFREFMTHHRDPHVPTAVPDLRMDLVSSSQGPGEDDDMRLDMTSHLALSTQLIGGLESYGGTLATLKLLETDAFLSDETLQWILKKCNRLRELEIENQQITDAAFKKIGQLPLRKLSLIKSQQVKGSFFATLSVKIREVSFAACTGSPEQSMKAFFELKSVEVKCVGQDGWRLISTIPFLKVFKVKEFEDGFPMALTSSIPKSVDQLALPRLKNDGSNIYRLAERFESLHTLQVDTLDDDTIEMLKKIVSKVRVLKIAKGMQLASQALDWLLHKTNVKKVVIQDGKMGLIQRKVIKELTSDFHIYRKGSAVPLEEKDLDNVVAGIFDKIKFKRFNAQIYKPASATMNLLSNTTNISTFKKF